MTDSIQQPTADEKEVHWQPEGAAGTSPPDPEVVARPKRRTLTIAYKIRIINAVVADRMMEAEWRAAESLDNGEMDLPIESLTAD